MITPVWGVYVFILLLGISNGFTSTLLGALWPEVYGLANLGGIRAITVSAMVLSSAVGPGVTGVLIDMRSEEHTSELQSLMRISYAVFCLKKKNMKKEQTTQNNTVTTTKQQ